MACLFLVRGAFGQEEQNPVEKTPELLPVKTTSNFEVSVHLSYWSLDPIKGVFEEELIDSISKRLREEIAAKSRDLYKLGLIPTAYEQSIQFDSSGSNYGLEIRYYPGGKRSAFSLGFSLEKNTMRIAIQGPVKQEFQDGSYAEADAEAHLELSPLTTNLNFRWDMAPSWTVSPFFVFGLGIAPLKGNVSYDFTGTYYGQGLQGTVTDSEAKTLKELEEEIDFNIPNIFIVFQLALGVRAEISNITLNLETGFWDGITVRGGLGLRF